MYIDYDKLAVYVVFASTIDFPGEFVVRRQGERRPGFCLDRSTPVQLLCHALR